MRNHVLGAAGSVTLALAAALTGATAGAAPDGASATDVVYCESSSYPQWTSCPNSTSQPARHTYKNNRVSWTFAIQPGCTVNVAAASFRATETGIVTDGSATGGAKYWDKACNYVKSEFPNNSQLLRTYANHESNQNRSIRGVSNY
jgi:hypothetical protein